MKFGEILRELLEDNDITQKKLANDLNIAPTTIGNYVRGIREPDFETLVLLASYFKVSTDYLLDYHREEIENHKEDEMLHIYRCLSEKKKDFLIDEGKLLLKYDNL